MKISFVEAAATLEVVCTEIDSLDDIDIAIQDLFAKSVDNLSQAVDRRISFLKYAESQIESAKKMRDEWNLRIKKFELMVESLKVNTLQVMKANPGVPYKGSMGSLRAQKNSMPSLVIEDEGALLAMPEYQKQMISISLDKAAIKRDLEQGMNVQNAHLEYGDHLRIGIN